ncbi:MAG: hypothetical protein KJZ86_08910 [Caldilineaceae bacterium]|nr:hypothetical protein [Caldilineaceae bacterium]
MVKNCIDRRSLCAALLTIGFLVLLSGLYTWRQPSRTQAAGLAQAAPLPQASATPLSLFLPVVHQSQSTPTPTPTPTVSPTPTATPDSNQLRCNPTGGSGGLAAGTHDVTLAGRPATIIVGEGYDPATPTFLAYYLHGDGGNYQFHANTNNVVNTFIRQNGWIYVAPQAPAASEGYHPWHGPSGIPSPEADANLQLIADVLDAMFAQYNVCRDVVFGSGASGGAWFYDAYWFPNRGGEYPAFTILNCGASGINSGSGSRYTKLQTLSQNPEIVRRSEFQYTIGTQDFLHDEALISVQTISALGFSVSTEYLEGVTHCAYSTSTKTRDYWQQKSAGLSLSDK